jgi:hypothetical protein
MKLLSILLIHCSNCTHYVPNYCGPNWELSECTQYDRHADMCLILDRMEDKRKKRNPVSSKKESDLFSMELDCM